jgi:DNA-binding NarL/FixJ family response regulator
MREVGILEKLRVAIVDPSQEVRDAIASLIDGQAEIVARVATLRELSCLRHARVDVVIADFGTCSGSHRIDLVGLRRRFPHLRLILTTAEDEREYRDAAASLNADGWVPKRRLGRDLQGVLSRIA